MTTFETYLPIFRGFYGSYYDPSENGYIENEVEYINEKRGELGLPPIGENDLDVDWQKFFNDVAKIITQQVADILTEFLGFKITIEYEQLISPKEYNFYNDSIDCKISFCPFSLWRVISKYKKELGMAINERYSSRDGFISYYYNSFGLWRQDYNNDELNLNHAVGAVLDMLACIIIPRDVMLNAEYTDDYILEILNIDKLLPREENPNEINRRTEIGEQTT